MSGGDAVVVAYVPVLHDGYRRFFEAHARGHRLLLIGPELHRDQRPLAKDVRALDAEHARDAIAAWGICAAVDVLDEAGARALAAQTPAPSLVLPDEDVSHRLVERFFERLPVRYDTVFLRWDKTKTVQLLRPRPARVVDEREAATDLVGASASGASTSAGGAEARALAAAATQAAAHSVDWWRQVGAAIRFAGGELVATHNEHHPHPLSPYAVGDPRSNFYKGVHLELSTAEHAEARLIADAARRGIATDGAVMYVTDFPCPPCAKLIAGAGVARLYYRDGYAVLDGEHVLARAGVEVVRVAEAMPADTPRS
ncbi:deaminase [Conexibacter sp. CPCC 206217]|uniref:deoxycytidylate deaminase n=1 Tax=Conexibacter sp. CPCC 206217 TaxID=3064574 RepID=UPI002723F95A|nr:deaminase [Conexibacter sp. CPCC 206217]MDO8211197.1 deaminase [Conexibacter sp. CPCC 206217]